MLFSSEETVQRWKDFCLRPLGYSGSGRRPIGAPLTATHPEDPDLSLQNYPWRKGGLGCQPDPKEGRGTSGPSSSSPPLLPPSHRVPVWTVPSTRGEGWQPRSVPPLDSSLPYLGPFPPLPSLVLETEGGLGRAVSLTDFLRSPNVMS